MKQENFSDTILGWNQSVTECLTSICSWTNIIAIDLLFYHLTCFLRVMTSTKPLNLWKTKIKVRYQVKITVSFENWKDGTTFAKIKQNIQWICQILSLKILNFFTHLSFLIYVMLFVIGAISHTGCNETEKAAYGTTEVKFTVCSVRNDCRENDFNLR